jgi:hypothetical protein
MELDVLKALILAVGNTCQVSPDHPVDVAPALLQGVPMRREQLAATQQPHAPADSLSEAVADEQCVVVC